jgi:hypothetical protein
MSPRGGWIDYKHIAKFGDRWLLVNVLWERRDGPLPAGLSGLRFTR